MIPWELEGPAVQRVLTEVVAVTGGWNCIMGAVGLFVPHERCFVPPQTGEIIYTIGGLGDDIRGIQIGDRCYRYFTLAENQFKRQQWLQYHHEQNQKEAAAQSLSRDAQVAALPLFFQERIFRFRDTNPNFRRDSEAYELFCCEQAVCIKNALKTDEAVLNFSKHTEGFNVPGFEGEKHSGLTFGGAIALARVAIAAEGIS